jgi:hypothetical protein
VAQGALKMKKHRRHIKRLAKRLKMSLEETLSKYYNNQDIDKNVIYSIKKRRNKGINN